MINPENEKLLKRYYQGETVSSGVEGEESTRPSGVSSTPTLPHWVCFVCGVEACYTDCQGRKVCRSHYVPWY